MYASTIMHRITLNITLIVSLLINSTGPGYALRPIAQANRQGALDKKALLNSCGLFLHEYNWLWGKSHDDIKSLIDEAWKLSKAVKRDDGRFGTLSRQLSKAAEELESLFDDWSSIHISKKFREAGTFEDERAEDMLNKMLGILRNSSKDLETMELSKVNIPKDKITRFLRREFEALKVNVTLMRAVCRRFLKAKAEFDLAGLPEELDIKSSFTNAKLYFNRGEGYPSLRFRMPAGLPKVKIDPDLLEEVWFNMIRNAVDARAKNIRVSARSKGGFVSVNVKDDGDGIRKQDLKKIFERFWTTKGWPRGTGVGLYICKEIITNAGGTIEVKSSVGKGATFTVSLPAVVESTSQTLKTSSAGERLEPLLHFPKWLQEELEPVLVDRLGREAATFLLKGYSFAFIGRISDIPARLKKRLGPVRYFNNRIIVCENALSSVADIFKKEIPRYESLSVKSVKRELLQVALYYAELELKIRQRELNFDKLKEQILKIYGETKVRSPEFRLFLKGFRRQYGDRFRKDTELLRKLITHLIAEVVLFGNLPKVILDSSGRPGEEEDINREIVRSCIRFIEEAGLVSGEEIRRLKELAKKGGASKREKKKMFLNIFDFISRKEMMEKINRALDEDKQKEDSATQHTIRDDQQATAVIEAQQNGILAGLEIARLVFEMVDEELEVEPLLSDGDELTPGKPILIVRGNARSIIGAERLVLNYLQTLSGIATLTAEFVKPTAGTNVKILDTRKTFPEMRPLQKYAVRVGGGKNHRMDLKEMVIIKDTHLALIRQELGRDEGIIAEAVNRVRSAPEGKNLFVEVEVRDIDGAKEALQNGVDRIMLDNMSCADMKRVVRFIRRSRYYRLHAKPTIEASGNVGLKTAEGFNRVTRTVEEVVGTGVDYISVGLITRAAPSLDIHLEIRPEFKEMDINELIKRLTGAAEIPKVTAERAESGRGKEKKVSAEKPQNLRKLHELIENNA